MNYEPQQAILCSLVRIVERQATILGIDIQREITEILEKVRNARISKGQEQQAEPK